MGSRRRPARSRVAALVGGATLAVAACSACSGSTKAPQTDSAQVTAAPHAPSTRRGAQVDAQELTEWVQAAITQAGSATYRLSGSATSGGDATGVLRLAGRHASVSLDLKNGSDRLQVVSVPGTLYANVGQVVQGRHWVKIVAGATDQVSTTLGPLLTYMTSTADIEAQAVSWAQANLFLVGSPKVVGGVPTTEYDATVPQAAVLAALPAQFRSVMQATVTGDTDLRVWLDAQGRPLEVVSTASYNHTPNPLTVRYTGWGSASAVTTPPASDVIPASGA